MDAAAIKAQMEKLRKEAAEGVQGPEAAKPPAPVKAKPPVKPPAPVATQAPTPPKPAPLPKVEPPAAARVAVAQPAKGAAPVAPAPAQPSRPVSPTLHQAGPASVERVPALAVEAPVKPAVNAELLDLTPKYAAFAPTQADDLGFNLMLEEAKRRSAHASQGSPTTGPEAGDQTWEKRQRERHLAELTEKYAGGDLEAYLKRVDEAYPGADARTQLMKTLKIDERDVPTRIMELVPAAMAPVQLATSGTLPAFDKSTPVESSYYTPEAKKEREDKAVPLTEKVEAFDVGARELADWNSGQPGGSPPNTVKATASVDAQNAAHQIMRVLAKEGGEDELFKLVEPFGANGDWLRAQKEIAARFYPKVAERYPELSKNAAEHKANMAALQYLAALRTTGSWTGPIYVGKSALNGGEFERQYVPTPGLDVEVVGVGAQGNIILRSVPLAASIMQGVFGEIESAGIGAAKFADKVVDIEGERAGNMLARGMSGRHAAGPVLSFMDEDRRTRELGTDPQLDKREAALSLKNEVSTAMAEQAALPTEAGRYAESHQLGPWETLGLTGLAMIGSTVIPGPGELAAAAHLGLMGEKNSQSLGRVGELLKKVDHPVVDVMIDKVTSTPGMDNIFVGPSAPALRKLDEIVANATEGLEAWNAGDKPEAYAKLEKAELEGEQILRNANETRTTVVKAADGTVIGKKQAESGTAPLVMEAVDRMEGELTTRFLDENGGVRSEADLRGAQALGDTTMANALNRLGMIVIKRGLPSWSQDVNLAPAKRRMEAVKFSTRYGTATDLKHLENARAALEAAPLTEAERAADMNERVLRGSGVKDEVAQALSSFDYLSFVRDREADVETLTRSLFDHVAQELNIDDNIADPRFEEFLKARDIITRNVVREIGVQRALDDAPKLIDTAQRAVLMKRELRATAAALVARIARRTGGKILSLSGAEALGRVSPGLKIGVRDVESPAKVDLKTGARSDGDKISQLIGFFNRYQVPKEERLSPGAARLLAKATEFFRGDVKAARINLALIDTIARNWSDATGRPSAEWWRTRISDIKVADSRDVNVGDALRHEQEIDKIIRSKYQPTEAGVDDVASRIVDLIDKYPKRRAHVETWVNRDRLLEYLSDNGVKSAEELAFGTLGALRTEANSRGEVFVLLPHTPLALAGLDNNGEVRSGRGYFDYTGRVPLTSYASDVFMPVESSHATGWQLYDRPDFSSAKPRVDFIESGKATNLPLSAKVTVEPDANNFRARVMEDTSGPQPLWRVEITHEPTGTVLPGFDSEVSTTPKAAVDTLYERLSDPDGNLIFYRTPGLTTEQQLRAAAVRSIRKAALDGHTTYHIKFTDAAHRDAFSRALSEYGMQLTNIDTPFRTKPTQIETTGLLVKMPPEIAEVVKTRSPYLFQNKDKASTPRGFIEFVEDNKAVIVGLENRDPSTFIHEVGHLLRSDLAPRDMDALILELRSKGIHVLHDGRGHFVPESATKLVDEVDSAIAEALLEPETKVETEVQATPEAKPETKVEAPASTSIASFKTSKGSTYDYFEDQTSTRNKAARTDVGHEGDSGPKKRSAITVFATPDAANALALPQGVNFRFNVDPAKRELRLLTRARDADDAVAWGSSPTQVVKFTTTPEKGLIPIELWLGENKTAGALQTVHFGNEIVEVTPTKAEPKVEAKPEAMKPEAVKSKGFTPSTPDEVRVYQGQIRARDNAKLRVDKLRAEMAPFADADLKATAAYTTLEKKLKLEEEKLSTAEANVTPGTQASVDYAAAAKEAADLAATLKANLDKIEALRDQKLTLTKPARAKIAKTLIESRVELKAAEDRMAAARAIIEANPVPAIPKSSDALVAAQKELAAKAKAEVKSQATPETKVEATAEAETKIPTFKSNKDALLATPRLRDVAQRRKAIAAAEEAVEKHKAGIEAVPPELHNTNAYKNAVAKLPELEAKLATARSVVSEKAEARYQYTRAVGAYNDALTAYKRAAKKGDAIEELAELQMSADAVQAANDAFMALPPTEPRAAGAAKPAPMSLAAKAAAEAAKAEARAAEKAAEKAAKTAEKAAPKPEKTEASETPSKLAKPSASDEAAAEKAMKSASTTAAKEAKAAEKAAKDAEKATAKAEKVAAAKAAAAKTSKPGKRVSLDDIMNKPRVTDVAERSPELDDIGDLVAEMNAGKAAPGEEFKLEPKTQTTAKSEVATAPRPEPQAYVSPDAETWTGPVVERTRFRNVEPVAKTSAKTPVKASVKVEVKPEVAKPGVEDTYVRDALDSRNPAFDEGRVNAAITNIKNKPPFKELTGAQKGEFTPYLYAIIDLVGGKTAAQALERGVVKEDVYIRAILAASTDAVKAAVDQKVARQQAVHALKELVSEKLAKMGADELPASGYTSPQKIRFYQGADETSAKPSKDMFYSGLARTVEERIPKSFVSRPGGKSAAAQALDAIRKSPLYRAEEDKWTGLSDWLRTKEGQEKIDSSEILVFVMEQTPKVEIKKFEGTAARDPLHDSSLGTFVDLAGWMESSDDDHDVRLLLQRLPPTLPIALKEKIQLMANERVAYNRSVTQARRRHADIVHTMGEVLQSYPDDAAAFSSARAHGREAPNLPPTNDLSRVAAREQAAELLQRASDANATWRAVARTGWAELTAKYPPGYLHQIEAEIQTHEPARSSREPTRWPTYHLPDGTDQFEILISPNQSEKFNNPHFRGETGTVHIRGQKRVVPDGKGGNKTILELTEIQNDWAQSKKAQEDWHAILQAKGVTPKEFFSIGAPALVIRGRLSTDDVAKLSSAFKKFEAQSRLSNIEDLLPEYPHKASSSWVELGLKTAIRKAAEDGIDEIRLISGDVVQKIVGGEEGGQLEFYNEIIPNIMDGLGNRISARVESAPSIEYINALKKELETASASTDPEKMKEAANLKPRIAKLEKRRAALGESQTTLTSRLNKEAAPVASDFFREPINSFKSLEDRVAARERIRAALIKNDFFSPEVEAAFGKWATAAEDPSSSVYHEYVVLNNSITARASTMRNAPVVRNNPLVIKLSPELMESVKREGLPLFHGGEKDGLSGIHPEVRKAEEAYADMVESAFTGENKDTSRVTQNISAHLQSLGASLTKEGKKINVPVSPEVERMMAPFMREEKPTTGPFGRADDARAAEGNQLPVELTDEDLANPVATHDAIKANIERLGSLKELEGGHVDEIQALHTKLQLLKASPEHRAAVSAALQKKYKALVNKTHPSDYDMKLAAKIKQKIASLAPKAEAQTRSSTAANPEALKLNLRAYAEQSIPTMEKPLNLGTVNRASSVVEDTVHGEIYQSLAGSPKLMATFGFFLGIGADEDHAFRAMPPEARRVTMSGVRPIQEYNADISRLVSEWARDPDLEDTVFAYLNGEATKFADDSHTPTSGGTNHTEWAVQQLQARWNALDPEDQARIEAFAMRNGRDERGWIRPFTGPEESADVQRVTHLIDGILVRANYSDASATPGDAFVNLARQSVWHEGSATNASTRPQMQAWFLTMLDAADVFEDSRAAAKETNPSRRLVNALSAHTPDKIKAPHHAAVLLGTYGGMREVGDAFLSQGFGVSREDSQLYARWRQGLAIPAEAMPRVAEMAKKYGLEADFSVVPELDVGALLLPRETRLRIQQELLHGRRLLSAEEKLGLKYGADTKDVLSGKYTRGAIEGFTQRTIERVKNTMVFGNLFMRAPAYINDMQGLFEATGSVGGLAAASRMAARRASTFIFTNAIGVAQIADSLVLLSKTVSGPGSKPAKLMTKGRNALSKAADASINLFSALITFNSANRNNPRVVDILEGGSKMIETPNGPMSVNQVRAILRQEGVFATFERGQMAEALFNDSPNDNIVKRAYDRGTNAIRRHRYETNYAISVQTRVGNALAFMEMGYDPRTAGRLALMTSYDYVNTSAGWDKNIIYNVFFPFQSFRKNNSRFILNRIVSYNGVRKLAMATRLIGTFPQTMANFLEALDRDEGDRYGVDEGSLTPEARTKFDKLTLFYEEGYAPLYGSNPDTWPEIVKSNLALGQDFTTYYDGLNAKEQEFLLYGYGGYENVPTSVKAYVNEYINGYQRAVMGGSTMERKIIEDKEHGNIDEYAPMELRASTTKQRFSDDSRFQYEYMLNRPHATILPRPGTNVNEYVRNKDALRVRSSKGSGTDSLNAYTLNLAETNAAAYASWLGCSLTLAASAFNVAKTGGDRIFDADPADIEAWHNDLKNGREYQITPSRSSEFYGFNEFYMTNRDMIDACSDPERAVLLGNVIRAAGGEDSATTVNPALYGLLDASSLPLPIDKTMVNGEERRTISPIGRAVMEVTPGGTIFIEANDFANRTAPAVNALSGTPETMLSAQVMDAQERGEVLSPAFILSAAKAAGFNVTEVAPSSVMYREDFQGTKKTDTPE